MSWWNQTNWSPQRNFRATLTLGSSGNSTFRNKSFLVKSFTKPAMSLVPPEESTAMLKIGRMHISYHPTAGYKFTPIDIEFVTNEKGSEDLFGQLNTLAGLMGLNALYDDLQAARSNGLLSAMEGANTEQLTAILQEFGVIKAAMEIEAKQALGEQIIIDELGHDGRSTGKWIIMRPFITKLSFSPASYDNDQLATILLQLQYTNYKYENAYTKRQISRTPAAIKARLTRRG